MYVFLRFEPVERELGKTFVSRKLDGNESYLNRPIDLNKVQSDGVFYPKAPADMEQVKLICDCLSKIDSLKFENWEHLSWEERLHILQEAEYEIAKITHRNPCEIKLKNLSKNNYGYYSPKDKTITINKRYLCDNSLAYYKETLNTFFHEGRHAYQDYNLTVREVHPSFGDLTNWRINENKYGYQSSQIYGFKLYWMQPVEADARKFAEDVIKEFNDKL